MVEGRERTHKGSHRSKADGVGDVAQWSGKHEEAVNSVPRTSNKAQSQDRCDPDNTALHTGWISAHTSAHLWFDIPRKDRGKRTASRPHAQVILLLYRNGKDKHTSTDRWTEASQSPTYHFRVPQAPTYQHNCGTYI